MLRYLAWGFGMSRELFAASVNSQLSEPVTLQKGTSVGLSTESANIQIWVSRMIHSSRILTGGNLLTDLFQLKQNSFCPYVELPLPLETIAVSIRQRTDSTVETKLFNAL